MVSHGRGRRVGLKVALAWAGAWLLLVPLLLGGCQEGDGPAPESPGARPPEVGAAATSDILEDNRPVGEQMGYSLAYEFYGRTERVDFLMNYAGTCTRVGPDPRFIMVVSVSRVVSGSPPMDSEKRVAYAIHSLSGVLHMSAEEAVGTKWRFLVWKRPRDDGGEFLWLEAHRQEFRGSIPEPGYNLSGTEHFEDSVRNGGN